MGVTALSSAVAGSSGATQAAPQNSVTKDEFLKLFVTQLKYQDPLNPMDSAGFTSQLAQFSSLEQLTNINDGMTSLLGYQNSLQNAFIGNFVGKRIGFEGGTSADGTAEMQYGTVTSISFDSGKTYFVVDGSTNVAPGDVTEIQ
jgi:flagellar basal-body rod modification protein FlgD